MMNRDNRNSQKSTQKTAVRIFCLVLAALTVLGTCSYLIYMLAL